MSFTLGELRTAKAGITVTPGGLNCVAELYLVQNNVKIVTSGKLPFTSTGIVQNVSFPVTMPGVGTYSVYLDVSSGSQLIAGYVATENVVVQAVTPALVVGNKVAITHVEGIPFSTVGISSIQVENEDGIVVTASYPTATLSTPIHAAPRGVSVTIKNLNLSQQGPNTSFRCYLNFAPALGVLSFYGYGATYMGIAPLPAIGDNVSIAISGLAYSGRGIANAPAHGIVTVHLVALAGTGDWLIVGYVGEFLIRNLFVL